MSFFKSRGFPFLEMSPWEDYQRAYSYFKYWSAFFKNHNLYIYLHDSKICLLWKLRRYKNDFYNHV